MAAVSVDEKSSDVTTAVTGPGPLSEAELRTAVNATLRSRGKASTRTALSKTSTIEKRVGVSYDAMVSAFSAVTVSYLLLAVNLYVEAAVSVFHLAFFSYRSPAVSKDLIKTAYHLLKMSYDNKLLTAAEILEVTRNTIIKPMARQNQQFHVEENQRTAQLQTMRTTTAVSR
uniref:HTH psq-type domain-containing protein n=1 Tax=Caenorhabditis tropicalis TaxID=1561998 RepID=A0A1I7UD82_9PELO